MVSITYEQYKILLKISKGKYVFVGPDNYKEILNSDMGKNIDYMKQNNLIDMEQNKNKQPYWKNFILLHDGVVALEKYRTNRRLQMWITTFIALACPSGRRAALVSSVASIFF